MKTRMGNSSIGDSLIDGSDGWHILLSGIVGSTAYGLAGPESDVDRIGFAAAPTVAFHGLHMPAGKAATKEQHKPDVVVHEAGKAVALLLQGNPTVSEVLWLESYETCTDLGAELIGLRQRLMCTRAVRSAYLGYATSQFMRLKNRGRFPDVPVSRIKKHGRHLWRLVSQSQQLYLTGSMTLRIDTPHLCHQFADRLIDDPENGLEVAERLIATTAAMMDSRKSALRDEPDVDAAERWLRKVRHAYYTGPEVAA